MTEALRVTGARRDAAVRFGKRLRATMQARGVGQRRLLEFLPGSRSTLRQYIAGYNLPRVSTARRFAEVLADPTLVEIAIEGRTKPCELCGTRYCDEEGSPSRYCSQRCREVMDKKRGYELGKDETRTRAARAERRVAELEQEVTELQTSLADSLAPFTRAVAAFCGDCEPQGICMVKDCSLRPVSPLPLYRRREPQPIATAAAGRWGGESREDQVARHQERLRERWEDDGQRALQAERSRRFHESMSPKERAEHGQKISAGRRRIQEAAASEGVR